VVRARREQCGAAQGGHAVRAGAETTCLIYTYQGQLKEFAFSCLPCFCHKLLANINCVTRSSWSRLLRKPLENQRGTNMLLDRCQQVTNRITTNGKSTPTLSVPRGSSHTWGISIELCPCKRLQTNPGTTLPAPSIEGQQLSKSPSFKLAQQLSNNQGLDNMKREQRYCTSAVKVDQVVWMISRPGGTKIKGPAHKHLSRIKAICST